MSDESGFYSMPPGDAAGNGTGLIAALLDSRQRWRDMIALAVDFAFETDKAGRFVLVIPDPALGWPASALLNLPASQLLADPDGLAMLRLFLPEEKLKDVVVWLKRRHGPPAPLSLTVVPLRNAAGAIVGARGVGVDVMRANDTKLAAAAALRRAGVIEHMLARLCGERTIPRIVQALFEELMAATGAEGGAVLDISPRHGATLVPREFGTSFESVRGVAISLLLGCGDRPRSGSSADGRGVLVSSCSLRFAPETGVVLWRAPAGREWDAEDTELVICAGSLMRFVLEQEATQREIARRARTDFLTGLFNQCAFFEEIERRLERLRHDANAGMLLVVDVDRCQEINQMLGRAAGDDMLCQVGVLLREMVRPSDLLARLDGDEFAIWLDGADPFVAAERADAICRRAAEDFLGSDPPLTLSIGIADWRGQGARIEDMIEAADRAIKEVRQSGRGQWRMAREDTS